MATTDFKTKAKNFLGVKDIWSDIKNLPKYFKILLIVAIFLILFFNFFDVQGGEADKNWFVPISRYNDALNNYNIFGKKGNTSAAMAVAILYSLNGLASFTGVVALSMIVSGHTSQYFWGLLNAIFYGAFAISVGYTGDVIMNVILICGAPVGWYLFEVKGLVNKQPKKYSWKFNIAFYTYTVLMSALLAFVLYSSLPQASHLLFGAKTNSNGFGDGAAYSNQAALIMDSMANGMQLVGYGMQLTNMPQQFIIWLFVDVVKILKFTGLGGAGTLSINMLIEFAVWLTIASIGAVNGVIKPYIQSRKAKK